MGRLIKILKCKEGFTLLELMISLAIMSFGMLGVVGMFVYAIGGNAQGRNLSKATSLAGKKIEEIKLTPFENLTSDSTGVPSGIYNVRYWTRKEIAALEMRKATVSVTWQIKGVDHEVKLSSAIAKQ